jgi:hypothetical protein
MVQLVFSVIRKEIIQRAFQELLVLRIAQGPADQHGRTVANVRRNHIARQFRPMEVP